MLNKIEDAILDIKNGKMVIVVDDENRENEGDLIIAAENCSYEAINFMVTKARGLICVPITRSRAKHLGLNPMIYENTDSHGTAFTVSVDSLKGTTTGISVQDRLNTIHDLANPVSKGEDFKKPGHIFPLIAKDGGVVERDGHTEAAVDLARLAGLKPAGVICEILKEDGTMARLDDLKIFAKEYNLKIISIEDLITYRKKTETLITRIADAKMPTKYGTFELIGYENAMDDKEHMAILKGELKNKENVLIRIHSECFTGDLLGSLRCDCGAQLQKALKKIDEIGEGAVLYLRQEGRGIGLYNKLRAYQLQDNGCDTVEANNKLGFADDLRDYAIAAQMIKELGIKSVRLMTNNPRKIEGLKKYGIEVLNREHHEVPANEVNKDYLKTKKEKLDHMLDQDFEK